MDPLATGVLVTGVGKGTKQLNDFLGCTKSYETVVLFGAETDTYDKLGKVVRRAPYEHITREAVEAALEQFRGKIMQRPPIFSALKVQGKKLYEYAREGKEPPIEIKERPIEVSDLRVLEWYAPGTHDYQWPAEEAPEEEKVVAEKLLDAQPTASSTAEENGAQGKAEEQEGTSSTKRKSPPPAGDEGSEPGKKQKVSAEGDAVPTQTEESSSSPSKTAAADAAPESIPAEKKEGEKKDEKEEKKEEKEEKEEKPATPQPAAVKITMTVSSGFYVRSLAHDLGKALGSCGLMSALIRTRQADFELEGDKILEYKDLEAGEEVWGPKVQRFLEQWEEKRVAGLKKGSRSPSPS